MGLMVDTNVFIRFEKSGDPIDFSSWEGSQEVYICVVIASELLMGVHRANTEERRLRRSAFVEAIIAGVGVLDFTVAEARLHAEIYAELAKKGQMIGAHDLIIAATARCHGLSLGRAEVALSIGSCSSRICYGLFWRKNCRRNHCIVGPSVRSSQPSTCFCGVSSNASLRSSSVGLPSIAPIASTKPVTPSWLC